MSNSFVANDNPRANLAVFPRFPTKAIQRLLERERALQRLFEHLNSSGVCAANDNRPNRRPVA